MNLSFVIHIPRRNSCCSVGREPLNPGIEYFSLLRENENNEYERQDFCASCWANVKTKSPAKYWKSKVPVKMDAIKVSQTKEAQIWQMLKTSMDENTLEALEENFVLALYLARIKNIVLRKEIVKEDQSILQIYEVLETEEMLAIKKMELSKLRIEEIQARIALKLNRPLA